MKKLLIALVTLPFMAGVAAAEPKQLTDQQMDKPAKKVLTNVELDKVAAGALDISLSLRPGAFAFAIAKAFGPITFVDANTAVGVLPGGLHFAFSSSTSFSKAP